VKHLEWSGSAIRLLSLVVFLTCATAQVPKTVKTWTFTLPHGTLRINLQLFPDGTSSLGTHPGRHGNEAPIVEQIEPLKQVLAEMPGLGADPHKLVYMGKMIFGYGQDVTEKLAYACADSKECRFRVQSPEREKVRVLITLLNQSGIFEPYNEAFKDYGMRVQVTAAEKVILLRFSSVPPRNSRDRANGRMLVLGGADISMRFSRINSNPNDRKE